MDMCEFCCTLAEHLSTAADDEWFLRNAFSTLDHKLSKMAQGEREAFFQDDWAQVLPIELAAFMAALAEYVYLKSGHKPPLWVSLYNADRPSYGEFLGNADISDNYKTALEKRAHATFVKHGLYLSENDVLNSY